MKNTISFYERDVKEEAAKNNWLFWQFAAEEERTSLPLSKSSTKDTLLVYLLLILLYLITFEGYSKTLEEEFKKERTETGSFRFKESEEQWVLIYFSSLLE